MALLRRRRKYKYAFSAVTLHLKGRSDGKQRFLLSLPRMLRLTSFISSRNRFFLLIQTRSEPLTATESTFRTRRLRDCRVARGNVRLLSTLHCFLRVFISPLLSPLSRSDSSSSFQGTSFKSMRVSPISNVRVFFLTCPYCESSSLG